MNRTKKGIITGIAGTIFNLVLAVGKLIIGIISGSVSVQSDAVNNFGDVASSVAVAFSFAISGKKADKDHPYGHGRFEYVAGFILAAVIIVAAVEFTISSIKKIIAPSPIMTSPLFFGLIAAGVAVKILMGIFYHINAKKLNSPAVRAARDDSFQDVLISSATLISLGTANFTRIPLDGIIGAIISLFILFNGIRLIKATIDKILGGKHNKASSKIMSEIMEQPEILGAHDLLLHDYGPDNSIGSVHVELPSDLSLNDAHRIINQIEKNVANNCGAEIVAHLDPVDINDSETKQIRKFMRKKLEEISPALSFHDFRVDKKLKIISVDIVVPYDLEISESVITERVKGIDFGEYKLEFIIDYV